ncbi:hypothetical protein B0H14DRAFT_2747368 [Mycena olivaceomarginata]|nr:hypothetical protein B0H14DRAFT_2747368 [Mycena olivaceomarginata]
MSPSSGFWIVNRASQRKIPCYRDRLAALLTFKSASFWDGAIVCLSHHVFTTLLTILDPVVYMCRYLGAKRYTLALILEMPATSRSDCISSTTALIYDDPTYLQRDRHLRSSRRYICLTLAPTIESDFLVLSEATSVPILITLGRHLQAYFASSG